MKTIDTIYSIWGSSKRLDINSIFKALVKDNATNIGIHSAAKEVKNMVENGLLENRKTCQGLDSFFILNSIQTVFSNDNDTLRKELNLDFSPDVSLEKQVTLSVEIPEVSQQINAAPVVHEVTDFSVQLVAVKALFMSEMYEVKREINRLRENINKMDLNRRKIICIRNTKSKLLFRATKFFP